MRKKFRSLNGKVYEHELLLLSRAKDTCIYQLGNTFPPKTRVFALR